jgi:tRNA threonylcarbamoyladenosine biosynthesis protein TsaB
MKLLSIDTSTPICSVCISDSQSILGEYVTRSSITHSERLMPAIEFLFSHLDWGIDELDGLAVINGPGSFTGLRISLSVIKGLAFALKVPVVAVNALEVAAYQVPFTGLICPAMDARRGEIFTCLFERSPDGLLARGEPLSITPSAWRETLPSEPIYFCGPGAEMYYDTLKNNADSRLVFSDLILARTLSQLADRKFAQGEILSGNELKAAYLRPSDAELKGPRSPKQPAPVSE